MGPTSLTVTQWPAWWEFMFQWGGILIQAAAAAATVAAVWVALRASRKSDEIREDQQRREATIVLTIAKSEVDFAAFAVKEIDDMLVSLPAPGGDTYRVMYPERLDVLVEYLKFPGLWRLIEKLPWLPHTVGNDVAELMTMAPILVSGMRDASSGEGPR